MASSSPPSRHDAFSPSLTLAGMDFIAPSAACIRPTLLAGGGGVGTVGARHMATATENSGDGKGRVGRAVLNTGAAATATTISVQDVVKISLQDCLACSGCVTTAETVLVNAQSRHEVEATLLAADATAGGDVQVRPRLVSISAQSCASLAAHLRLSKADTYALIAGFVRHALTPATLRAGAVATAAGAATADEEKSMHCDAEAQAPHRDETATQRGVLDPAPPIYVIDLEWAESLSVALTALEYNRRWASRDSDAAAPLPLIVSACPGWVCYCEKQGSSLLPHLSPVLSAQGIAGSYAKRVVASTLYHVSIQPCFDRKLEAARDHFVPPHGSPTAATTALADPVYYTDCVLSTAELLEWMREVDPTLPWRGQLDTQHPTAGVGDSAATSASPPPLLGHRNLHDDEQATEAEADAEPVGCTLPAAAHEAARLAGSGGYHQHAIAHRLRATHATLSAIKYEVKRNHNHQLATCDALPGEVFAIGYGFQQIQNVVRGLKRRTPAICAYTFVELMACPDGCLNGGGQVRSTQRSHTEVLDAVIHASARYNSAEVEDAAHGWATLVHSMLESTTTATAAAVSGSQGVTEELPSDHRRVAVVEEGDDVGAAMEAKRRRIQVSPSPPPLSTPFAEATIASAVTSLGDALWRCTFRDRESEFAELLNAGNVHSLKW